MWSVEGAVCNTSVGVQSYGIKMKFVCLYMDVCMYAYVKYKMFPKLQVLQNC